MRDNCNKSCVLLGCEITKNNQTDERAEFVLVWHTMCKRGSKNNLERLVSSRYATFVGSGSGFINARKQKIGKAIELKFIEKEMPSEAIPDCE